MVSGNHLNVPKSDALLGGLLLSGMLVAGLLVPRSVGAGKPHGNHGVQ